jgi:uncharacterized lipoprotein YddW (UPF0748 family)
MHLAAYIHLSQCFNPNDPVAKREADLVAMVERAGKAGFQTLVPYISTTSGKTLYPSQVNPHHEYGDWDALACVVKAARTLNMRVVPTIPALVSGHDRPAGILADHLDWALLGEDGQPLGTISPGHPDARSWVLDWISEICDRYQPDGLLLDYMRYPSKPSQFESTTAGRYQQWRTEQAGLEDPQAEQQFRELMLTELMEAISNQVRSRYPDLELTIYSWGFHVTKDHRVAQPWPNWVAKGLIDQVNVSGYWYPESYPKNWGSNHLDVFRKALRESQQLIDQAGNKARLTFALGVKTSHGQLSSVSEIADYLRLAQELKVAGTTFFTWSYLEPFLPELNQTGILAAAAKGQPIELNQQGNKITGDKAAAEPNALVESQVQAVPASAAQQGTLLVATFDSSQTARSQADFVADGHADQVEVNAAIAALPEVGGTVVLAEGTYDIRHNPGSLGGVIISRSNVVLAGRGPATKLRLAADQNTNVIRIIGSGIHHVVVRDLQVDANRQQNSAGQGDPNLSHDRFEFCGIKGYCRDPRGPAANDLRDITVRNCEVRNSHRLGIMLEGSNLQVLNNVLGNAGSDSVELLTGPGIIDGNYVEITEQTHVAIGSDRANNIQMTNNIVHVKRDGRLDIGFRTWSNSQGHVIQGNTVIVDSDGRCALAMDLRGQMQTVQGNSVQCLNTESPSNIRIGGGNTLLSGNLINNTDIEVQDTYPGSLPIQFSGNVLSDSQIRHQRGRLVQLDNAQPSPSDNSAGALRFRVSVDRGQDIGQCFGSLFEATSDDGQITVGAGFQNAYNTRLRADRHSLQFFVRDNVAPQDFTVTKVPRPNELCGTYLHSIDDQVISTYGGHRKWNASSGTWQSVADAGGTGESMRVGRDILRFGDSCVLYNGQAILDRPDRGDYQLFFYANGYLCFYHVDRGDQGYRAFSSDQDGFSRLLACPWSPADARVDLSKAIVLNLPVVGETTFAWGVLEDQIVTGSNIGGFYKLAGGSWSMMLEPDIKTSFQLYSSLAYHDRLLMGQYPTGRLFAYDGRQLSELADWPPSPDGFSRQAREAQTTAIYGGEVLVGIWPWGELWRLAPDSQRWSLAQRMFDHPLPAPELVHPYDAENRHNAVPNLWGQRITSLISLRDDLWLSTSAKAPVAWDADLYPFLAPPIGRKVLRSLN